MTKRSRSSSHARGEYDNLAQMGFICLEEVDAEETERILADRIVAPLSSIEPVPTSDGAAKIATNDNKQKSQRALRREAKRLKVSGADDQTCKGAAVATPPAPKSTAVATPQLPKATEAIPSTVADDKECAVVSKESVEKFVKLTPDELRERLPKWERYIDLLGADVLSCVAQAGYDTPAPVQTAVLDALRARKDASKLAINDLLVTAPTGSGKTLAFLLPIVSDILRRGKTSDSEASAEPARKETVDLITDSVDKEVTGTGFTSAAVTPTRGPYALVVAPTRELAIQIADCARRIFPCVHTVAAVGGMSAEKQERLLSYGADILVATPGRLAEILQADTAGVGRHVRAGHLSALVLDEADRLVERGHFEDLDVLFEVMPRACRQTMLLSATLFASAAASLTRLRKRVPFASRFPRTVVVTAGGAEPALGASGRRAAVALPAELRTETLFTPVERKDAHLAAILAQLCPPGESRARVVVFVNAIETVRVLSETLRLLGVPCVQALHAHLQQRQRIRALERFVEHGAAKNAPSALFGSQLAVLVTSDVAARGLDLPAVDAVIQYHVPRSADMLQHRAGRTARAGATGTCILLVAPPETALLARVAPASLPEHALPYDAVRPWTRPATLAGMIAKEDSVDSRDARARKWERHAADVLGVELSGDSDGDSDGDSGAGAKKRSSHRAELASLLRAMQ